MFQDSIEDNEKMKSEYTAKLLEATEKYRVTLQENEELKEKVEILFKLGRGYIDKTEPRQNTPPQQNHEIIDETVETEGGKNETENLSSLAFNKYIGFRRVSPSTTAQASQASPTPSPRRTSGPGAHPAPPTQPAPPAPSDTETPTINDRLQSINRENRTPNVDTEVSRSVQYCHYFTNYGKCTFEEKTGYRCRFEHSVAPMCQRGTACERAKCMYTHPNVSGRNNTFLGRNMGFQNNIAPWPQMMNQFANHWNMMTMNPFQQQTLSPFQHQAQGQGRVQN